MSFRLRQDSTETGRSVTLPFIPAAPLGGLSAPLRQTAEYFGEGE